MNEASAVFRDPSRCANKMLVLLFVICAFVSERQEDAHRLEHRIERRHARRRYLALAICACPIWHILLPASSRSFSTTHLILFQKGPRWAVEPTHVTSLLDLATRDHI